MKIILVLWLTICVLFSSVYSQGVGIRNKSLISAGMSYYMLYNNTPIIQKDYFLKPHSASHSIGLSYQWQITDTVSWYVSADLYTFGDYTPLLEKKAGDIRTQNFLLIQCQYQRIILQSKRSELKGELGLSFRAGSAVVHVSYYDSGDEHSHSTVLGKGYLDVGIPFGMSYTYYLGKHFHLSTRLTHTFFPYTYEKKTQYSYDKSPFRNMTSLRFGIGFNFGNLRSK